MASKKLLDYKAFISREPACLDSMHCNVETVSGGVDKWAEGIRARIILANSGSGAAFEWYFDDNNFAESLMELDKMIDGLREMRYHLVNFSNKRDNE